LRGSEGDFAIWPYEFGLRALMMDGEKGAESFYGYFAHESDEELFE
jgi:hypothetical protein